jgi:hypothetical protein
MNEEDKMATRKKTTRPWEIRIFYLVFGIICLANLAYYGHGLLTLRGAMRLISEHDPWALSLIISRITWFLVIGILIWLLAYIYQLIKSISGGEPFGSRNPRRVRRIAYGALALASVVFLEELLRYMVVPSAQLRTFLYNLMGVPMWAGFFGFTLLVICRVFEEGLRLKQDENLTI